jgi:hypothetical protein
LAPEHAHDAAATSAGLEASVPRQPRWLTPLFLTRLTTDVKKNDDLPQNNSHFNLTRHRTRKNGRVSRETRPW